MLAVIVAVVAALRSTVRSRLDLTAELFALRHHLRRYLAYYHNSRPHLSLDKDAPLPRATQSPSAGRIVAIPEVGGLHHHYERRAA